MPAPNAQPIIIIRKKAGHGGGHHGGAWKVAFADFVTAMLALFIVLWLLSSSEQVQKAVGGYFTDPKGKGKDVGNGLRGSGSESLAIRKDDMPKLKDKLEQAIKDSTPLNRIREHVVFTVTSEGLRVELIEGENATFFESGSSRPTDSGKDLIKKLAEEIGKLPNKVTMEGHTDSRPFPGGAEYTNWELSTDRANAARRWMQQNGMRDDQVTQIRGFADQSPRNPQHPEDASNRRITLVIMYQASKPQTSPDAEPEAAGEGKAAEGKAGDSKTGAGKDAAKGGAKDAPAKGAEKAAEKGAEKGAEKVAEKTAPAKPAEAAKAAAPEPQKPSPIPAKK